MSGCFASSQDTVVIDPVLNYDPAASTTYTRSVDEVIRFVEGSRQAKKIPRSTKLKEREFLSP